MGMLPHDKPAGTKLGGASKRDDVPNPFLAALLAPLPLGGGVACPRFADRTRGESPGDCGESPISQIDCQLHNVDGLALRSTQVDQTVPKPFRLNIGSTKHTDPGAGELIY